MDLADLFARGAFDDAFPQETRSFPAEAGGLAAAMGSGSLVHLFIAGFSQENLDAVGQFRANHWEPLEFQSGQGSW
jgi:hypothetical protein